MIGLRVWDVIRAIDFLQTRREIDQTRIATMGISGGGTVSLFSAALDERIKVGVVSGYFNTFRDCLPVFRRKNLLRSPQNGNRFSPSQRFVCRLVLQPG